MNRQIPWVRGYCNSASNTLLEAGNWDNTMAASATDASRLRGKPL